MYDGTAFVCDLCEKRFNCKSKLEQHRIVHTFVKPFACDADGCEKKFTQKASMRLHKCRVHEKVPSKYRCEHCDRSCSTSDVLKNHLRTHTGERPYACTKCAMKFTQRSSVQAHCRAAHTNERAYACINCEKTFPTAAHRGTHTTDLFCFQLIQVSNRYRKLTAKRVYVLLLDV